MVRIKDVAELAGVSVSSVSRFLNAPETLKEETRKKVEQAVTSLQYFPSLIARSLRTKATQTIAFIIPSLDNLYYVDVFGALRQEASKKGYTVNLVTTGHDHDTLRRYLNDLSAQSVDGAVIGFLDDDEVIGDMRIAQKRLPIVLLTSTSGREEFNSIFVDAMEGEMRATQHLIDCGCRRIAFVGGIMNGPTIEKKKGFEAAMRRNNLPIDPELYFFKHNHFITGFWAVREFVTRGKEPDGIVCATDDIAMGCVKHLIRSGYKVPEDVKVIGFNGISLVDIYEPSISSLRHPIHRTAEEAVELLHERILYPNGKTRQVSLYTSLVVNTSTDPEAPARFSV